MSDTKLVFARFDVDHFGFFAADAHVAAVQVDIAFGVAGRVDGDFDEERFALADLRRGTDGGELDFGFAAVWERFGVDRHAPRCGGGDCITMGEYMKSRHRPELYTVGLYMYRGSAAMNNRTVYTIYPAMDNSLEGYLHAAGEPYLFLDLLHLDPVTSPAWVFNQTMARSWGYNTTTFIPREQYDGLLYIEQVRSPQYTY